MKIRNFVKSFAALVAFFTPSDGKGYYERKGQKNVTRGVVDRPKPTSIGVDLADKGTEAITAVHSTSTSTLSVIDANGCFMLFVPVNSMSSVTHLAIDMVQRSNISIDFEVVGYMKDYYVLRDLLCEIYETDQDMLKFVIVDYRNSMEISGKGYITSLGIEPLMGLDLVPINFGIEVVKCTVTE